MTWDEVCANRYLQDLPFRIETNRWGQIVMHPRHNGHSFAQSSIFKLLLKKMQGGEVLQETVIDTEDGNKVADTTWMSDAFYRFRAGRLTDSNAATGRAEASMKSKAGPPALPVRWSAWLSSWVRGII